MPDASSEVLRFDDLSPYLLLKNGNYLYKVPFRDGWAVLKVYFGDRNLFQYVSKTLGNVLVNNQTSFMPLARWRTEKECMKLWRQAGFRVFDIYEDVRVEGCVPEQGWTLFEYVDRPRFVHYFADEGVPLDERLAMWERFLPVWHRRHAMAIDQREPRLVHENGDLKHVMIMEDCDFLFFDFEMCYRAPRRTREFVAREILAYLKSLGKCVGAGHWETFLKVTADQYPDRELLDYTYNFAFRNPNPAIRAARWLDRKIKPRAQKPFSKYNTASKLKQLMQI
ncbi:MAG: hypothetical protein ACYTG7_06815 [Planctomycetota bacterium]|jgi:hypothetical protein